MTTDGYYPGAIKRINKHAYFLGNSGFGALVMHIAADNSRKGGDDYLGSTPTKSAHLFVNKDGSVKQYVSVNDSAWCNGISSLPGNTGKWLTPSGKVTTPRWQGLRAGLNPNWYTVSMEHQGNPSDVWTAPMFATTVAIMKWLAPIKGVAWWQPGVNLIGHGDINPLDKPFCPGPHCDYQALALAANSRRMVATTDVPIYEVPAVNPTRVALAGAGLLRQGTECIIAMGYANGMVWLADGTGFVEGSKLRGI
jgi:hypothetical protein